MPDYTYEQVNRRLFQDLLVLRSNLSKKIAMWREMALFYKHLGAKVACFHVPEVQDTMLKLIYDDIKKSNPHVRQQMFQLMVQILCHQHDSHRRQQLH